MVEKISKKKQAELTSKASRATISEYFSSPSNSGWVVSKAEFDTKKIKTIVRVDSVVKGAIRTLTDKMVETGWCLQGKDNRSRQKDAERKLQDLRFEWVLRRTLYNLFTYNNAFIEIVRNGRGEPVELHVLETDTIEILSDKHGEIKGYEQRGFTGEVVTFQPDEIVHIKSTSVSSLIWGDIDLETIYNTVMTRYYIKQFLNWLYRTNQFRPIYNLKAVTTDQVKDFVTYLKASEKDIEKPILIQGEFETMIARKQEDFSTLTELLQYFDAEIISLLQVPPLLMGNADSANRSSSDGQERAFMTHIRSTQRLLEEQFTYELLPKINYDKIKFIFLIQDVKAQKDSMEVAERMRNMGFKEEIIANYLNENGFLLPPGDPFKKAEEQGISQPSLKKSMDMFPSRRGKNGESNDKIGTGERGTTRQDQLVQKAEWSSYPYTYEVKSDAI